MTTFLHKISRPTTMAPVPVPQATRGNEALVDIVLAVTANANWSQPGIDGRLGRSKTPKGEVILATLTYCYALGIYSSERIEAAIYKNRNNWELLDRLPLDRTALARFRKNNRDLVQACLTQVLGQMASCRMEDLTPPAITCLDLCQEAERRINSAVTCDFLETEE
jgi:hypothetical protein